MSPRRRLWPALFAVTLVAVAVPVAEGARSSAATPFSPKLLRGSWSGTWTNQTFGTSGPIKARFTTPSKGRRLRIALDFGGSVFGCSDPPESTITLPKGKSANRWNSGGFRLVGPSIAFGQRTLRYSHGTRRLTGKGQDPPCAQGLTWTLSGRLSKTLRRLTATVDITLPDGSKAVSKLDVRKR